MITLTHGIEDAPRVIEKAAKSLDIKRAVRIPPRYYTKKLDGVRTFNVERAERNLDDISEMVDGAKILMSDIEGDHRDIMARPDLYPDKVDATESQYLACWAWFDNRFPDADLYEWNLTNSTKPDRHPRVEKLVLDNLAGFAVSCFYREKGNWFDVREKVVAHANSLVAHTGQKVLAGIHEMHNSDLDHMKVPVPREIVGPMVNVALQADIAWLWSITYTDPIDNLALAHARILEVLTEMVQQSQEQTE